MKSLKVTCEIQGEQIEFTIENISWYSFKGDVLDVASYYDPTRGVSIHHVVSVKEC